MGADPYVADVGCRSIYIASVLYSESEAFSNEFETEVPFKFLIYLTVHVHEYAFLRYI